MNSTSTAQKRSRTAWGSTIAAAGLAAFGSLAVNSVIAWAGRDSSDTAESFEPLLASSFGPATIAGAVAGAIGWRLIVEHHQHAAKLLRWLTPTVLALSLIPDVMMLVSDSEPGSTVGRVVALMLMHLAIGIVSVPLYRKFMPPRS
jgi:uncharacterized protein DUF6069